MPFVHVKGCQLLDSFVSLPQRHRYRSHIVVWNSTTKCLLRPPLLLAFFDPVVKTLGTGESNGVRVQILPLVK